MALTATQIEDRKTYIGGADAPIIFSPEGLYNKTRVDVWLRLTGMADDAWIEDGPKDRTWWGSVLQRPILDAFRKEAGKEVYEPDMAMRLDTHPYMGALLDGYIFGEAAIVEVKNRSID